MEDTKNREFEALRIRLIDHDCTTIGLNEQCKQGKYIPENYIDCQDIKILMKIQEEKCFICKCRVSTSCKKGCKNRITLAKVNSKNPYLKGNCLVACWYCKYRKNSDINENCDEKCCTSGVKKIPEEKDISHQATEILDKYNQIRDTQYSPTDDFVDYKEMRLPCHGTEREKDLCGYCNGGNEEEDCRVYVSVKATVDHAEIMHEKSLCKCCGGNPDECSCADTRQNREDDRCSGCGRHDDFCRCYSSGIWWGSDDD